MSECKKTICVTGSSGFIGRNIVEHLRKQKIYEVMHPTHRELNLLSKEAVDIFFANKDIDCLIHCANIGGNRKCISQKDIVQANTRMFFNLLENKSSFKKIIHMGSGAEYNKKQNLKLVKENFAGKSIPLDDYGYSKYLISKYIEHVDNVYCLRLFAIYGKYEDYEYKFISNSILKNILKMPIIIKQNVFFDWMYIDDLIKIVDFFINNEPTHKIYNISTGKRVDLKTIAELINEVSESCSEIIIENEGLNYEYTGDNQNLIEFVGNYQFMSLKKAIHMLMNYYSENILEINTSTIKEDKYADFCKIKSL